MCTLDETCIAPENQCWKMTFHDISFLGWPTCRGDVSFWGVSYIGRGGCELNMLKLLEGMFLANPFFRHYSTCFASQTAPLATYEDSFVRNMKEADL